MADRLITSEMNWRDSVNSQAAAAAAPQPEPGLLADEEEEQATVWDIFCNEQVLMRAVAMGNGTLAPVEEGTEWFTTTDTPNGRMFKPMVLGAEQALPPSDGLDLDWLRQEMNHPAPRGFTHKQFQNARALLMNYKQDKRTVPASHNTSAAGKAGQARLAGAPTAGLMNELLRVRLNEILTAGTAGSDKNTISKFLRYRHFYLQEGLNPIRWQLLGNPSAEVLAQEEEFFGRFVIWATLVWGDHGVVMQAISAVRKVHMNLAGIAFPEFAKVTTWAKKAA